MNARPANRMTRSVRALTLVAAVLLGMLYVTPLWSVRLVAPQYPEGLGMNIRLNTVEGLKEHDLHSINSLNRYIGMQAIEPDAIPELKYMPWIVAGLIVGGLIVAAVGRRRLLVVWVVAFALIGAAGMVDFWRWERDYGTNLDLENAIIVVPGMTYQPPLIGTKQLLNFQATSYPGIGGMLAGLSMLLAGAAVFVSYRRNTFSPAGVALVAATACAVGTPTIRFGVDACAECRMLISDARFGAALVTRHGKTLTFDSIACMVERLRGMNAADVRSLWVVDANASGKLIPAEDAFYVQDGVVRPPMGDIVAFATPDGATAMAGATGATLSWPALREFAFASETHAR